MEPDEICETCGGPDTSSDYIRRIAAYQAANSKLVDRCNEFETVIRAVARGRFIVEAKASTGRKMDEIEAWCKVSIKAVYKLLRTNTCVFGIFEDKADAALFKTFWYE